MILRNGGITIFHCLVSRLLVELLSYFLLTVFSSVLIILLLAPHPSWLIVLVNFHLQTLRAPVAFLIHLLVSYALTFLAFSSLIVCVSRDPGPVSTSDNEDSNERSRAETSLTEALLEPMDDFNSPAKWCKKCWAPKPERTHHCSLCRRCVLKMGP
jgi:palmitoyltransferase ZDHHC2/15/20